MALSFTMASGHGFGPAHPRSLHPVLDEVLAGPLDRTTGDRQTCRQILVIAHAGPVTVEIVGHDRERLTLVASEPELGDRLAHALDHLAAMPLQNSLGTQSNPLLRLQTTFGMEDVGRLPQLLQYMQQIEDQSDIELFAYPDLQSAFSVGERHVGFVALGIAAGHLGGSFGNHRGLAFGQARPYALVLRTRCRLVRFGDRPVLAEEAFHHLLRSADPGCSRKYGGHRGHLLTVSLLTDGAPLN